MTREEAILHMTIRREGLKNSVGDLDEDIKAFDMAIRALEQCEPCENCISRQAVFEQINCWIGNGEYRYTNATYYLTRRIKELPSINPIEPNTGHWEWVQYDYNPKLGNWHCSECRCIVLECVGKEEKGGIPLYKYCPMCGAKLEVEE